MEDDFFMEGDWVRYYEPVTGHLSDDCIGVIRSKEIDKYIAEWWYVKNGKRGGQITSGLTFRYSRRNLKLCTETGEPLE